MTSEYVKAYIGIDPGVTGGIGVILEGYGAHPIEVAYGLKMPQTDRDLLDGLAQFRAGSKHLSAIGTTYTVDYVFTVLERVSASPQMGVVSAFTFGRGVGALRMALAAKRLRYVEVTPQRWQQVMGCRTKGDKNITKRRAQALFPQVPNVTHATADALLLAQYCRQTYGSGSRIPEGAESGKKENAAKAGTKAGTQGQGTEEDRRLEDLEEQEQQQRWADAQGSGEGAQVRPDPQAGAGPAGVARNGEHRPRPDPQRNLQAHERTRRRASRR